MLAIPCIIYFAAVTKYAVNLPIMDDYDAILGFLSHYKNANGAEGFYMLFSQHNEHRILLSRALYVVYCYLFGHVNFRDIIFIGNAQLLIMLVVIVALIKSSIRQWFLPALIVSICLFDFNDWENATFAMACVANFGILMLFMVSLYLYNKDAKWAKYVAAALQFIAIFSNGNGIVAAAILCLFTLLKKDRLSIILSVVVFVIFCPLYFLHYVVPATGHPSTDMVRMVIYFLHIISAHCVPGNDMIAVLLGCVVVIALLFLFPFQKKTLVKKELLPLACLAIFLLASMAMITPFRSNLQLDYNISSRYLIYPNLLMALIIVFLAYKLREQKAYYPVLIASTALFLIVYNMNRRHGMDDLVALRSRVTGVKYYYPDSTAAKNAADEACRMHIYCMDEYRR